jgi:glycerol-3-phosphate dehydrogenase (NAD(P)+)
MKIGIVGTTSWATTLAIMLAERDYEVKLLARTSDEARLLNRERENAKYLPGYAFPKQLRATASAEEALQRTTLVIFAVPSNRLRDNVRQVRHALDEGPAIVSGVKGLEVDTGKRMSQVLVEELPEPLHGNICVLSGPNLSKEIIQKLPAGTVVASHDESVATSVQQMLSSSAFRVYTNTDVIGVELGGALKNIIAIGAGIIDGLGLGSNAKASFLTRGLAEITRLGVTAGAEPRTFAGLAGLGDLMATCNSPLSRNRYVGEQLAKGLSLGDILDSMVNVAEGVDTTRAAIKLAQELRVEMPITEVTYRVLFEGMPVPKAAQELLSRAPRPEYV